MDSQITPNPGYYTLEVMKYSDCPEEPNNKLYYDPRYVELSEIQTSVYDMQVDNRVMDIISRRYSHYA